MNLKWNCRLGPIHIEEPGAAPSPVPLLSSRVAYTTSITSEKQLNGMNIMDGSFWNPKPTIGFFHYSLDDTSRLVHWNEQMNILSIVCNINVPTFLFSFTEDSIMFGEGK